MAKFNPPTAQTGAAASDSTDKPSDNDLANIGNDPQASNDAQNDPSAGGLAASTGNESTISATQGNTTENTPEGGPNNDKTSLQTDTEEALKNKDVALFAGWSIDGTLPEDPTKKDVAINKLREILKRMPPNPGPEGVLFGYGGVIFRTNDLQALFGKD